MMTKSGGDEARCPATTKAGEPCGAPSSMLEPSTGLCPAHREGGTERLRLAGQKGAAASIAKWRGRGGLAPDELPPLDGPEAAEQWLEAIGRAVATGRLGHNEAKAATGAIREWLRAHEAGAVSGRVEKLGQQLDALRGKKAVRVVK